MGATLKYEPVCAARGKSLSDGLKVILRDKKGLKSDQVLDEHDLAYLKGLCDAGVNDADKLIEAIEKYGQVRVWLEY